MTSALLIQNFDTIVANGNLMRRLATETTEESIIECFHSRDE